MFVTTLGAVFEMGAQLYMVIRSRRGGQVYVDTTDESRRVLNVGGLASVRGSVFFPREGK